VTDQVTHPYVHKNGLNIDLYTFISVFLLKQTGRKTAKKISHLHNFFKVIPYHIKILINQTLPKLHKQFWRCVMIGKSLNGTYRAVRNTNIWGRMSFLFRTVGN